MEGTYFKIGIIK